MTCNVKKHHRKRHPMSEGERVMWEICFDLIGMEKQKTNRAFLSRTVLYLAKKRRKRDALRDAGRNPYKRGDKK